MIFFIEKNSHQHQDPATSWKNQVVNIILIKTSKEKHRQKHQDPGKSWKKHSFNTFKIRRLKRKKRPPVLVQ